MVKIKQWPNQQMKTQKLTLQYAGGMIATMTVKSPLTPDELVVLAKQCQGNKLAGSEVSVTLGKSVSEIKTNEPNKLNK